MKTPIKSIAPSPGAKEFMVAIKATLAQFKDSLSAIEMLAVSAHLVGTIIALQDQRTVTKEMALELVASNIEAGNAEVLESLLNTKGTA